MLLTDALARIKRTNTPEVAFIPLSVLAEIHFVQGNEEEAVTTYRELLRSLAKAKKENWLLDFKARVTAMMESNLAIMLTRLGKYKPKNFSHRLWRKTGNRIWTEVIPS